MSTIVPLQPSLMGGSAAASQNSPPPTDKERWQALVAKYGKLGAFRPYWFGEPPPRIAEREPKLAWYIQGLIYATSLATLFVFGEAEIFLITKFGAASAVSIILGFLLGLLGMMVYAMDRSSARTIPRIAILAQRRQWGLWLEHVLYAIGVGSVQAFTYGLIIYTMENNAEALITGKSLIPPGAVWIFGLIIVRAVLLVWTIWHSYLTSEELEVQWGTFGRQGVSLVGGSALNDLRQLDVASMGLAQKLRVFDKLTTPPERAPGGWKFWNLGEWRVAQSQLNADHRQAVITTIEEMQNHAAQANQPTALAANANAAEIAALRTTFEQGLTDLDNRANAYHSQVDTLREEVQRLADQGVGRSDIDDLISQFEERFADLQNIVTQALGGPKNRVTTATSMGTKAPGAKAFPKAGTAEYRRLVREAGNRVLADTSRTVNFFEVAREMGLDTDDPANVQNVEATVRDLNAKRFSGLRSGQEPTPDALLDALL